MTEKTNTPGTLLDWIRKLLPKPGPMKVDPSVQAKIETPPNEELVPFRISVEGVHRNIPQNAELWIVTYEPETDMFFPSPNAIMLLPGGRWYTMASIGEDKQQYIGKKFEMILLMLPRAAAMSLVMHTQEQVARGKSLATGHIPREGVVMDRIIVTRW
jgi:hypothetical protein